MEKIKSIFIDLAINAGGEILNISKNGFKTQIKADNSPVTIADLRANEIIVRGLSDNFPDILLISEEATQNIPKDIDTIKFFLIDPLDGTKDFVRGGSDYTVNIALIENKIPIAGVVYAPKIGELYYGDKNGSFKYKIENSKAISCENIQVSAPKSPIRLTISRSHLDELTKKYVSQFEQCEPIQIGSSLKLCKLAEGAADLYPRFGPTSQWDIAAGHAVLLGAGGSIITKGQNPLKYGDIDGHNQLKLNPHFVAGGAIKQIPWL